MCLDHNIFGSADYTWLQVRESGQSSTQNTVKVAAWQALCLLAAFIPPAMHNQVRIGKLQRGVTEQKSWNAPFLNKVVI